MKYEAQVGHLWHSRFIGLREVKSPREVRRGSRNADAHISPCEAIGSRQTLLSPRFREHLFRPTAGMFLPAPSPWRHRRRITPQSSFRFHGFSLQQLQFPVVWNILHVPSCGAGMHQLVIENPTIRKYNLRDCSAIVVPRERDHCHRLNDGG